MTGLRPGTRTGTTLLLLGVVGGCMEPATGSSVGDAAPDYGAVGLEGDSVSLADFQGDVVLLNLWATWCPPCRVEMPDLQSLHREFRDEGLHVVGVSVDAAGSGRAVRSFLDELGIDFLILRDPSERVLRIFDAFGLPLTVLIGRDGVIRWRHLGPITADDPELREVLRRELEAE